MSTSDQQAAEHKPGAKEAIADAQKAVPPGMEVAAFQHVRELAREGKVKLRDANPKRAPTDYDW